MNSTLPAHRYWLPRAKFLLFGTIALMMLVVIYKDLPLLHPTSAIADHYRPFKWWLLPHGIAGGLALFLGPLQFSKRLRQRFLGWHRISGRVYVYGVAVAAPLGVYIEYVKYTHGIGSLPLVIATVGFATLWLVTTGIGFILARRRIIQDHRKWMTRSYAVALIFLETRCVDQIPLLTAMFERPSRVLESHSISDLWIYVLFAPIAAELVLQCEKMLNKASVRNKLRSAASA
jgi:uncharacterized membrane protein